MTNAKFPNFQVGTPNNLHFITKCCSKMKKANTEVCMTDGSVK